MGVFVRGINALWMIALPLGLAVVLSRRWRPSWRVFLLGAATFIGSQVLHIPFNRFLLQPMMGILGLEGASRGVSFALVALLLGLSAGIFEEGARYLVYRRWLPQVRDWRGAVFYGAGHGGVESLLVGLLALYVLLQAFALRGSDLAASLPADQVELAQQQLEVYWSAPWHAALLGALERTLALIFQVSLAVMVLQSVKGRSVWWLFAAVAWHALIDGLVVFAAQVWGVYWAEFCVFCAALVSLLLLWILREPVQGPVLEECAAPDRLLDGALDLEERPDLLREIVERSRYAGELEALDRE